MLQPSCVQNTAETENNCVWKHTKVHVSNFPQENESLNDGNGYPLSEKFIRKQGTYAVRGLSQHC